MSTWDYKITHNSFNLIKQQTKTNKIMTIKGTTCEGVDISFEIKSNNKALAAKMLLSECLFIQVINNIAYYTISYILEISEDISKEICYYAELEIGEEELESVIIENTFGEKALIFKRK